MTRREFVGFLLGALILLTAVIIVRYTPEDVADAPNLLPTATPDFHPIRHSAVTVEPEPVDNPWYYAKH
jgi:hypothetical protein